MTLFRETARAAHAAGICVLPPKQDGSKAPDAVSWTEFQHRLPTEAELAHWYNDPRRAGIGYVCGRISGGLELLDFDDAASAWEDYQVLIEDNGLGPAWERITSGYLERTRLAAITSCFAHHIRLARSNWPSAPSGRMSNATSGIDGRCSSKLGVRVATSSRRQRTALCIPPADDTNC